MRRFRLATILALSIGLLAAGCGDDDAEEAGEELSGSSQEAIAQDAEAKAAGLMAVTTLEVYFTENQSYAGATPDALAQIDPTLPVDLLVVQGSADGFEMTVSSESGNTFTATKSGGGELAKSCQTEGEGGCPVGGQW